MELFTLGIGNYSEQDVKEAARTFTGWTFDRTSLAFVERARQHDSGTKTLLGQTGNFDGTDTIRLVTTAPASARYLAARMWSRYASAVDPGDPVAADVAAAATDHRGASLLRAVLAHPRFRLDDVRFGLVRQPIEWVVGAAIRAALTGLGQAPFQPPSVGGWPAQEAWLNTAADQLKLTFARAVANAAAATPAGSALAATAIADRPGHLAWLLGLDGWQPGTVSALTAVADNPGLLITFALTAPDYQLA
jgi:uncharacterized protein (DUF1800 family)